MAGSVTATTIAAIATAVSAATGAGLAIDQAVTRPGAPGVPGPDPNAQKLAQQKAAFLSNQAGATTPVVGTSGLTGPTTATPPSGQATPNPADLSSLLKLINPGSTPANFSGGTGQGGAPQTSNGLTSFV